MASSQHGGPEGAVKQGDQVSALMPQSFLYTTAAKLGGVPVVWWFSLERVLQVTIRCRLNDRSFTDTNIISRHINGVHHNIMLYS